MSAQLGRKKDAIDVQWCEVIPSEHDTEQALLATHSLLTTHNSLSTTHYSLLTKALLAAEEAMAAPRLALAAALGEVAEAKACFEKVPPASLPRLATPPHRTSVAARVK